MLSYKLHCHSIVGCESWVCWGGGTLVGVLFWDGFVSVGREIFVQFFFVMKLGSVMILIWYEFMGVSSRLRFDMQLFTQTQIIGKQNVLPLTSLVYFCFLIELFCRVFESNGAMYFLCHKDICPLSQENSPHPNQFKMFKDTTI